MFLNFRPLVGAGVLVGLVFWGVGGVKGGAVGGGGSDNVLFLHFM